MNVRPPTTPRPNGPDWVRDAVFYQIFPDRFASSQRVLKPGTLERWDAPPTTYGFKGGDLLGIAEHLDELHELGITALYLTPVFASASNHRYHTFDYELVDPLLGGDAAFREATRPLAKVSWPGDRWGTKFAPRNLEAGRLVVEIEAREGLVLRVGRAR